jgi:hypothetical protein
LGKVWVPGREGIPQEPQGLDEVGLPRSAPTDEDRHWFQAYGNVTKALEVLDAYSLYHTSPRAVPRASSAMSHQGFSRS